MQAYIANSLKDTLARLTTTKEVDILDSIPVEYLQVLSIFKTGSREGTKMVMENTWMYHKVVQTVSEYHKYTKATRREAVNYKRFLAICPMVDRSDRTNFD